MHSQISCSVRISFHSAFTSSLTFELDNSVLNPVNLLTSSKELLKTKRKAMN